MLQRSIDAAPAMLQRSIRTRVLLAVSVAQPLERVLLAKNAPFWGAWQKVWQSVAVACSAKLLIRKGFWVCGNGGIEIGNRLYVYVYVITYVITLTSKTYQ